MFRNPSKPSLVHFLSPYVLTYKYIQTHPRRTINVFIVLGNSFVIVLVFIFHYVGVVQTHTGNKQCVFVLEEKKLIKCKTAGTGVIGNFKTYLFLRNHRLYRGKAFQTRKITKTSFSSHLFAPSNFGRNLGFVKTRVHFKI